jgi:hypothetical protein
VIIIIIIITSIIIATTTTTTSASSTLMELQPLACSDIELATEIGILYKIYGTPWMGDLPIARPFIYTGRHEHGRNADIHPCLDWDSKPRPKCWRGRKRYVPQKVIKK